VEKPVRLHVLKGKGDRLGGIAIEATAQPEGAPETSLVGWLPDQAALFGVLNALYNRHLPLRSVELIRLEGEPQGEQAA